ncbi:TolC family protein [Spirosoma sp. SC4-14]|uniref:TolC family protein n=1 Tax=Spirosoma sp. SC4-14 TaxID=3128900 RepID=UPI0030D4BB82
MKTRRIRRCWLILLSVSVSATAQKLTVHSLDEAWQYANQHNSAIATARSNGQIAQKGVQNAYGHLLPTIAVTGGFTDNLTLQPTLVPASLFGGSPNVFNEVVFGKQFLYNAMLSAQLDLLNLPRWNQIKAAKIEQELALVQQQKTKANAYATLSDAYYAVLWWNEVAVLTEQNDQAADRIWQIAQNRFREGTISEVSLNTAQINREKTRLSLETARYNQEQAEEQLKAFLELPADSKLALTETLTKKVLMVSDSSDFTTHPDVLLAQAQVRKANQSLKTAQSAFSPTLSALYQGNIQLAANSFLSFENASHLPQQYIGLRLNIPILAGTDRKYQTDVAHLNLLNSQQQYTAIQHQIQHQDQRMLQGYASALNTVQKSQRIMELYAQNDLHAQRRLAEGIIPLDERLRAFSDWIGYQNEYVQHLLDYLNQRVQLTIRQRTFNE